MYIIDCWCMVVGYKSICYMYMYICMLEYMNGKKNLIFLERRGGGKN